MPYYVVNTGRIRLGDAVTSRGTHIMWSKSPSTPDPRISSSIAHQRSERRRRFEEAITAHQKAAAIFRGIGDQDNERIALGNLEAARAAHA
jgi:hypothetical protein